MENFTQTSWENEGWERFCAQGASVDFYKKDGWIGFDSSSCTPPGPMVNAMVALNLAVKGVVMINHKFPAGLIPKIEANFNYEVQDLSNGLVCVKFTPKDGVERVKFDTNQQCNG